MFEKFIEAIGVSGVDEDLVGLSKRLRDAGVRTFALSHFCKDKAKADVSKIGDILKVAKDYIDGIEKLDDIMEHIKYIREGMIRDMFAVRNSFPTYKPEVTKQICKFASPHNEDDAQKDSHKAEAGRLLRVFLGWDRLPESIVNVEIYMSDDDERVIMSFGVKNKPTRIGISIPVEVDYSECWEFQMMSDAIDGTCGLSDCSIERLTSLIPSIDLRISVGAGGKDCRTMQFGKVEDVRLAIDKVLDYDIRDHIDNIEDISDVKDADQFEVWRMRRAANARAKENEVHAGETV